MGSKFLINVAAIVLIALGIAGIAMFVAVIVPPPQWLPVLLSFLNWPALGPLVSAVAVVAALYIAITGWRKNSDERHKDLELARKQHKDERKQVAFGVARVLYAELEEVCDSIIVSVRMLCEDSSTPPAIHFDRLVPGTNVVRSQFNEMHLRANYVLASGVLKKNDLSQVPLLFNFSIELGDKYMCTLIKYRTFLVQSSEHLASRSDAPIQLKRLLDSCFDAFNREPYTEKYHFYDRLRNSIDALKSLEGFRATIPDAPQREENLDNAAEIIADELIDHGVFTATSLEGTRQSTERYVSILDTLWSFVNTKANQYEEEMNTELAKLKSSNNK
ncbi:MAG: hypothetical protein COB25_018545 [Oceanospirillales bacterium]|nr:hypothetical protein [Oceanospirillales bacterium]